MIALDQERLALIGEAEALREKASRLEPENARLAELVCRLEQALGAPQAPPAVPPLLIPDDLEAIDGIGPAIAKKLNRAGVHTFAQLAAQSPAFLRSVLGSRVERLADEESLLAQARALAGRKRAGTRAETPAEMPGEA